MKTDSELNGSEFREGDRLADTVVEDNIKMYLKAE
jgi:hypothetical protein